MRLTALTDYSLRMLMHVAIQEDGRSTIAEVARAYGVSENHLMKVAHLLGQADMLRTSRGRGGGLSLARAAADITVGDVVRRMEPDMDLVPCFADGSCAILGACRLKRRLHMAQAAFMAVLDDTTLADLAAPAPELRRLLGMERPPGQA